MIKHFLIAALLLGGCKNSDSALSAAKGGDPGMSNGGVTGTQPRLGSANVAKHAVEQVTPPADLKTPPPEAKTTATGLIYLKTVSNPDGKPVNKNDTVLINYTGWKQATGETFFTNRSRGQPMPLGLATTAPAFTEAMLLMHKGEKALIWVPPGKAVGSAAPSDTLVYEVELIEVTPAPAIPPDVAGPPANAEKLAGDARVKLEIVRGGTGKDKPRTFDTVTFNITGWDADGHMFDTTEMRKHPASSPPFREPQVLDEVMTSMLAGERLRFWVDSEQMVFDGRPPPGMPKGQLCYEVEILQIVKSPKDPAKPPAELDKPPEDARPTEHGVLFKKLASGKGGDHPKPNDIVAVNFTGWRTNGRMFDSSAVRGTGEAQEVSMASMAPGWAEGMQQMVPGDHALMWIPEQMAYKGAPGRPQGMLVVDIELVAVKAAPLRPVAPPPAKNPKKPAPAP